MSFVLNRPREMVPRFRGKLKISRYSVDYISRAADALNVVGTKPSENHHEHILLVGIALIEVAVTNVEYL